MAFMTNQWLKSVVERNVKHVPVAVRLQIRNDRKDEWSVKNNIMASIGLTKTLVNTNKIHFSDDPDYQCVYLTREELHDILPKLFAIYIDECTENVLDDELRVFFSKLKLYQSEFIEYMLLDHLDFSGNRSLRVASKRWMKRKMETTLLPEADQDNKE